jgi:hypothetical protein
MKTEIIEKREVEGGKQSGGKEGKQMEIYEGE